MSYYKAIIEKENRSNNINDSIIKKLNFGKNIIEDNIVAIRRKFDNSNEHSNSNALKT